MANNSFGIALGFLSRLGSGSGFTPALLGRSTIWFFPAGCLLGLLAALAGLGAGLWLGADLSDKMRHQDAIGLGCGFVWLTAMVWLTYGMHWDGLADLADASQARGDDFRRILADSRLGTYGALAIFAVMLGQCIFAGWHFASALEWRPASIICLCLAPGWARLGPVWLSARPVFPASKLGSLLCLNVPAYARRMAWFYATACCLALPLMGYGIMTVLALAGCQLLLCRWLCRTASLNGGMSGDFFGASIELGQLIFLFATAG